MDLQRSKIFGKISQTLLFVIFVTFMITVTQAVSEILQTDELALESLRAGLLNLSAYAERIQERIEKTTFKEVRKGTIVVALSRVAKTVLKTPPLIPSIRLTNLSVKSSLAALTFEKTPDIERKVSVLHPFTLPTQDMFSVTEGPTEVTLIFNQRLEEQLKKHFRIKPKAIYTDIVGITAQLPPDLAHTPNVYYALLAALAAKRISIIAVVSTFMEISFIVEKKDMEVAMNVLTPYYV